MKTKFLSILFLSMLTSLVEAAQPPVPARVGLVNQGATCYQNALLQAIHKCTPLRIALMDRIDKLGIKRDPIINPLYSIFTKLSSESNRLTRWLVTSQAAYNPQIFVHNTCRSFFEEDFGQQDSQEFLSYLWNYFQEKKLLPNSTPAPETPEDPLLCQWAGIKIHKRTQCHNCYKISAGALENTFIIPLSFGEYPRKSVHVKTLLKEFTEWSSLRDRGGFEAKCDFCNATHPHDECFDLSIADSMPYLVLHLKRFEGYPPQKIHTTVRFDSSGIVNLRDDKARKIHKFSIASIVVHFGSPNFGHYFCVTRDGIYNDSHVTLDNGAAFQKLLSGSGDGYLYFLERIE